MFSYITVVTDTAKYHSHPGRRRRPLALAAALRVVLALNTNQREELAEKAISHVREKFTRAQMCKSTLDVYEENLSESVSTATALEESPASAT